MTTHGKHNYSFADVLVDPQRRLVLRQQEKLPVSKKGFDILMALIEREGDVITKDQLIAQVWLAQSTDLW